MCAWHYLIHSCVISVFPTAAGLCSLPWDGWYAFTTHSTAMAFQCLFPCFLIKTRLFVFMLLNARPHLVLLVCLKKWHDELKCLFYFLFFCRLLICFSLENRALCVGMPRSAFFPSRILKNCVWMLISKAGRRLCVSSEILNVLYVSQDNKLSSWLLQDLTQAHIWALVRTCCIQTLTD